MKRINDLRVAIMDHDSFALRGMVGQVSRDCRVATLWEADNPEVLQYIANHYPLDLIFVDVEYNPHFPALRSLLARMGQLRPQAAVVCMTNHLAMDLVLDAIEGGANGLFEKEEIFKGLLHGALRSQPGVFLYTQSVRPYLKEIDLQGMMIELVPSWHPNPVLTEEKHDIFIQCAEGGLRNATVAKRFGLKPQTIDKYISQIYGELIGSGWVDDRAIRGLNVQELSTQELAYLYYTALPLRNSSSQPPKASGRIGVDFEGPQHCSVHISTKDRKRSGG